MTKLTPGLALAAFLWSAVAWPCSPPRPRPWTVTRGALTVSLENPEPASFMGWTIKVSRGNRVLWRRGDQDFIIKGWFSISSDARWLAVYGLSPGFQIFDLQTDEVFPWDPGEALSPSARHAYRHQYCGSWHAASRWEKDTLVASLRLVSLPPPMGDGDKVEVRYDARTRTARRLGTVNSGPPVSELLARYEREPSQPTLLALFDASMAQTAPHPELARFWLEFLRAPEHWSREVAQALEKVGTDSDLQAAMRLPPLPDRPERELALFEVAKRRSPERAAEFARACLEERREPLAVRRAALQYLTAEGRAHPAASPALLAAAQGDPAPELRTAAVEALAAGGRVEEAVGVLLQLTRAPDARVAARAAEALVQRAGRATGSEAATVRSLLQRHGEKHGMEGFPEGHFILAVEAHVQGDLPRARALYRQAALALAPLAPRRGWYSGRLYRLAQVQRGVAAVEAGELREAEEAERGLRVPLPTGPVASCAPAPDTDYAAAPGTPSRCSSPMGAHADLQQRVMLLKARCLSAPDTCR